MINWYKRYVLWTCRVMQRIPGYRTLGRWMEEQYTKRFWTTVIWNTVLGFVINLALTRWLKRWLNSLPDPETTLATRESLDATFERIKADNKRRMVKMGEDLREKYNLNPEPDHYEGFILHQPCGEWHHPDYPTDRCTAIRMAEERGEANNFQTP